jgi:hypothetical protein
VPWLFISLAQSVVLTVYVNVGLRAFPDESRRFARRVTKLTGPTADETLTSDRRARVWMPWKAMILAP